MSNPSSIYIPSDQSILIFMEEVLIRAVGSNPAKKLYRYTYAKSKHFKGKTYDFSDKDLQEMTRFALFIYYNKIQAHENKQRSSRHS